MNAADRRRLTPALGITAAVLGVLLIALWAGMGRSAHWNDDADSPKLPPHRKVLPPPTVPPLKQYSQVWKRPLFNRTRRPQPVGDGKSKSSGDLQLTGVILRPGLKMAILHDKASHRNYRLVEGHPADKGPKLVKLHPRSAVVEFAGSNLQLHLLPGASPGVHNKPAPAAQPPASAPAATVVKHVGSSAPVASGPPNTKQLTRKWLAGLSPRAREMATRVLSGLDPRERKQAIQAFANLSPSQRKQAIRTAMSGSLPAGARARILKALIERRLRGARQN